MVNSVAVLSVNVGEDGWVDLLPDLLRGNKIQLNLSFYFCKAFTI